MTTASGHDGETESDEYCGPRFRHRVPVQVVGNEEIRGASRLVCDAERVERDGFEPEDRRGAAVGLGVNEALDDPTAKNGLKKKVVARIRSKLKRRTVDGSREDHVDRIVRRGRSRQEVGNAGAIPSNCAAMIFEPNVRGEGDSGRAVLIGDDRALGHWDFVEVD